MEVVANLAAQQSQKAFHLVAGLFLAALTPGARRSAWVAPEGTFPR